MNGKPIEKINRDWKNYLTASYIGLCMEDNMVFHNLFDRT